MEKKEKVYEAVMDRQPRVTHAADVKLPNLSFCVLMDLVGMASYFVPGLGEGFDLAWAPISGFIFMRAFGGMTGKIGGLVNMVEEALPFVDAIPTFTIGYFYVKRQQKRNEINDKTIL